MHLCYVDESGVSDIPGNTSHFILAGIAVPIWHWKLCDQEVSEIKLGYGLDGAEIHTAWILRSYLEQTKIPNFDILDYDQRRAKVQELRHTELLRLQRAGNPKHLKQVKKNYKKTESFIHLEFRERKRFINDIATCVSGWGFARVFAECINKIHFNPDIRAQTVDEQAFEQIVSRFEHYLENISEIDNKQYGLLIHDNNPTVAHKHTQMMLSYHQKGTAWTDLKNIIETPLFVDSKLTSLIQIADLCAYSLRRYLENKEEELFNLIFERADRQFNRVVGIRHFSDRACSCAICQAHNN